MLSILSRLDGVFRNAHIPSPESESDAHNNLVQYILRKHIRTGRYGVSHENASAASAVREVREGKVSTRSAVSWHLLLLKNKYEK